MYRLSNYLLICLCHVRVYVRIFLCHVCHVRFCSRQKQVCNACTYSNKTFTPNHAIILRITLRVCKTLHK